MEFKVGEALFTKDGTAVEFDHAVGDVAYARPILTTIYQSTSYSGDDYDGIEETCAADHLVSIAVSDLHRTAPVAVLNDEIEAARRTLAEMKAASAAAKRSHENEIRSVNSELSAAKDTLARWQREHGIFKDIGRILDGESIYPISAEVSPYHKAPEIPQIPKLKDVVLLELNYNKFKSDAPWSVKTRNTPDSYRRQLQIFFTEAERDELIAGQFATVCNAFRKNPNYSDDGALYTTRLDFGRLTAWRETHPILIIPDDILAGKDAHESEAKELRRRALLAEAEALGSIL